MSKGHAAAVQYPYLVKLGVMPKQEWDNWGVAETSLRVFGNNTIPGIDVTSGSLGHGVGIGAGIALANRMNNIDAKVYVVISEGELYEGSTWEALLFLAHHKLTNVKVVLDVNRNMILGRPEDCVALNLQSTKKWKPSTCKRCALTAMTTASFMLGWNSWTTPKTCHEC